MDTEYSAEFVAATERCRAHAHDPENAEATKVTDALRLSRESAVAAVAAFRNDMIAAWSNSVVYTNTDANLYFQFAIARVDTLLQELARVDIGVRAARAGNLKR